MTYGSYLDLESRVVAERKLHCGEETDVAVSKPRVFIFQNRQEPVRPEKLKASSMFHSIETATSGTGRAPTTYQHFNILLYPLGCLGTQISHQRLSIPNNTRNRVCEGDNLNCGIDSDQRSKGTRVYPSPERRMDVRLQSNKTISRVKFAS